MAASTLYGLSSISRVARGEKRPFSTGASQIERRFLSMIYRAPLSALDRSLPACVAHALGCGRDGYTGL